MFTETPMDATGEAEDDNRQRVEDEVSALRAIYGEEGVSYSPQTGALSVTVSALNADKISFACLLPQSYPSRHLPRNPTLRADKLSAKECVAIVDTALPSARARLPDSISVNSAPEECVFDYCQAVISSYDSYISAKDGNESVGLSTEHSTAEDASGSHLSHRSGTLYKFAHGEPLTDRKSVFQAHVAHVDSVSQAVGFVGFLCEKFPKIATATHNIMACRVGSAQDYDDDGENAAGKSLLFTLQQQDVDNIVVVVSRWFGGVKLGSLRFKHINNVARALITSERDNLRLKPP